MAEGFAKQYLPRWTVKSAGIEAHGLNPKAVRAMAEVGVDITSQTSDIIAQDILENATLVVTLCQEAADKCPVIPPHVRHEHWGFDDPAKATGTDAEQWQVFQMVRDAIKERIQTFSQEQN